MSNLNGGVFGSAAESNVTDITTSNSYNSSATYSSSVDRTGNVVIGAGSSGLFNDQNSSLYTLVGIAVIAIAIVVVLVNKYRT